jgi:mono/diheme cytochrome c family protein
MNKVKVKEMKRICVVLFANLLFAQDWFITNYEYGKMLYNNPRGISCAKCHGQNAKGKTIVSYFEKKKKLNKIEKIKKTIKAPNIQNITYEELKNRLLNYKYLSIMPKYNYLTNDEIEALYLYIQAQKGKK